MLQKFFNSLKKQNTYIFSHLIIILVFTNLYYFLAEYTNNDADKKEFSKSWERDLYYSVVTHFTVGFGDITPKSILFRRLTMCQIFLAFIFFNR